jgi:polyisoprenoid-binding protein YceI
MSRSSRSFLPLGALLAMLALAAPARAELQTYAIDRGHSDISFKVRHLVAKTTGGFNSFSGTIQLDQANLAEGSVSLEIESASIDTNHEKRDAHLKGSDFFAVDSFPTITFKSTKVVAKSAEELVVTGDLTMRGVTKPVDLTVLISGFGPDPRGNQRAGFEVTGKLDRKDFGITWNRDLDTGGTLLDDVVTLTMNIEAVHEKPEDAEAAAKKDTEAKAAAAETKADETKAVEGTKKD